ncbi:hypothetical protein M3936_23350 [Sutcliffiella horikoshii]|uniref:hypothetical protein n=1 Tax=Sutcliffiella horikoshii TaxID=79883 RepID=UPI00203BA015|nr:hypothetical protein [Sutcliffiella horikoshii]MCM3620495.1 hypothetical protein [Sutcliffiella horikoshii]
MNRSLSKQLSIWKKQQTSKELQKQKFGKTPEKLTEQDLRELMGTNGPRYVRKKGGAFIQR